MDLINKIVNRLGKIIILLLSMLISVLLSRLYGVEVVGQYIYLMTTLTILVLLISFGTNQSMLANFSKKTINDLIAINIKLYFLTFSCITFSIVFLYKLEIIFNNKSMIFVFTILIISLMQSIGNIFKNKYIVEDKIYLYYYFDILQYVLLLLGIIFFYFLNYNNILYILLNVYVFFIFIVFLINKSSINFRNIVKSKIKKEYFTSSFLVFVSTLFLTLSSKYNIFIYDANFSQEIFGYYAISMFLIDGIILFLSSIMFADINRFKDANNNYILIYVGKYLLISIFITLSIYFFGEKILQIVYHVDAHELGIILGIMKYSLGIVLILKIIQNYFIMNKLYKYYLYNSILFISMLVVTNYFYKETFETILYNYLISLIIVTIFAVVLYIKNKLETSNDI